MKRHVVVLEFRTSSVPSDRTGMLIEQLRYAGVLSAETADDMNYKLTIHCPKAVNRPEVWAQSNADRMRSFGLKAEAKVLPG